MIQLQNNSIATVLNLAKEALDAFCDDLSTMFEVDIACTLKDSGTGLPKTLKPHFKKLGAVHTVKAEGSISGQFPLIFDQGGLFILAGVIVMLPDARIKEEAKRGSEKDAEAMSDAVGEVGNLLVGTWDRVFREELKGHKHFSKANTYVGPLWKDTEAMTGIPEDRECDYAVYELTVKDFPSFTCGVLLGVSEAGTSNNDSSTQPEIDDAVASEAPTEQEAEAESLPATVPGSEAEPETEESVTPDQDGSLEAETVESDAAEGTDVEPAPAPTISEEAAEPASDSERAEPPATMAIPIPAPSSGESVAALNLTAEEILDPQVVWAASEDSVEHVLNLMQQQDAGYALVGDHGRLEGIVSKSNIMGALSPYLRPVFAKWRRPADDATLNIKIKWIMSRPVRTVGPNTTLAVMMEQMCQFGGRCLPVVETSGKVLGVVTVFELLRALNASHGHHFVGRTPQAPCLLV